MNGCVTQQPLKKVTQSGKPEGIYKNKTKESVKDVLIGYCNQNGMMVYDSNDSSVTCGKERTDAAGILVQAMIGNAHSTTPVQKILFTIGKQDKDVRVWADMWIETQMATGQINKAQLTNNNAKNAMQDTLDKLNP
ncbi:hypothetical protein [Symbiopectobacterium purcellii]|uniref:hypothetical protein n=1 Tax=Symbiopectobacterium purcellii TaxID=2871826 RepID=UPI002076982B|nr:hypothetical protein [Symbiopectobacterium purcellii]